MLKKIIIILSIAYSAILYSDIHNYYSSVNNEGYTVLVEKNPLTRPFTYIMIDRWTGGGWIWNPTKTERWFIREGIINGKVEFFQIIDSHIPTDIHSKNKPN